MTMKTGNSVHAPAFVAALGLTLASALGLFSHLIAYQVVLSGRLRSLASPGEQLANFSILAIVAFILLVVGIAHLTRRVFHVWWAGAIAWSLASVFTGLWPLTALLPAALRLGNRRAARFATFGGATLLLTPVLTLAGCFWMVSWPMLASCAVGAGLLLAAFRALDEGSRGLRILAWIFVAVVLAALATQPALHAGRISREADAAMAELLDGIASPIDPRTVFPGPPPVPEAEDPVAALDTDAIKEDERSFRELQEMLRPTGAGTRRHPLTREELSFISEWFSSHTNLTAAVDAITDAPGYRSCLPGPESLAEFSQGVFLTRDPRVNDICPGAHSLLSLRAKLALASGDADASADATRRLVNLQTCFEAEPTMVGFLYGEAMRSMPSQLIATRIDLWDEDDLLAIQNMADEAKEAVESRMRMSLATEILLCYTWFEQDPTSFHKLGPHVKLALEALWGSQAFKYWIAFERRALYRNMLPLWKVAECLLRASGDAAIGEDFDRFRDEVTERYSKLPLLAISIAPSISAVLFPTMVSCRDRASFVRAAVAVERFRRVNGTLPQSLDALVPDFLADIPRAARTGEPLLYEPGPIEIPEETFPVLRDPDEAAAESSEEFRAHFGETNKVTMGKLVGAINAGYGRRDCEKRILPAQTLPGFRLTMPDRLGRKDRETATDFLLPPDEGQM